MTSFDSILAFIEGAKSVIGVSSGVINSAISDAVANGIERGFKGIRKSLERSLMKITLTLVSVFFILWGAALVLDNFVPYHGLGFVIVGAFLGLIVLLFLREN